MEVSHRLFQFEFRSGGQTLGGTERAVHTGCGADRGFGSVSGLLRPSLPEFSGVREAGRAPEWLTDPRFECCATQGQRPIAGGAMTRPLTQGGGMSPEGAPDNGRVAMRDEAAVCKVC